MTGQGGDPWAPPPTTAPQAYPPEPVAWPPPQPSWPQPSWPPPWPGQPPPPGWPVGPSAPPARTTNTWAVVSLVTGILALVPVAFGTGITGLVQIGRTRQAGTGLAVAGLLTCAGWVVLAGIVAGALWLSDGFGPAVLGRVADAGPVRPGACSRQPPEDASVATPVACAAEHDAEVFHVEEMGGRTWPGYEDVDRTADAICYDAFEGYVGESYEFSDYEYGFFAPDHGEWDAGERRVVCVVLPGLASSLDGSVRVSGQ